MIECPVGHKQQAKVKTNAIAGRLLFRKLLGGVLLILPILSKPDKRGKAKAGVNV